MAELFQDTLKGTRGAVISVCGQYRYSLYRLLREDRYHARENCLFIMLNPSIADGVEDDPTIRRCMKYTSDWDYALLDVVNLFSFRATNPKDLPAEIPELCGPNHGYHIDNAIIEADLIICAWGKEKYSHWQWAAQNMLSSIKGHGKDPMCLKVNKDGSPAHPLYLKSDLKPIEYIR